MKQSKKHLTRTPASLPDALNKRLAAYALAATAGLLVGAPAAEATIVYKPVDISGVPKISVSVYSRGSGPIRGTIGIQESVEIPITGLGATLQIGARFEGFCLAELGPGICDGARLAGVGASLRGKGSAAPGSFIVGPGVFSASQRGFPAKLPSGALISQGRLKSPYGGLLWSSENDPSGGSQFGAWLGGGKDFLGFSDQGHAGWVSLNLFSIGVCLQDFRPAVCFGGPVGINVAGYAYETNQDVAIRAGQTSDVPEPGTLSLLALGAVGLFALRKKRQALGIKSQPSA